MGPEDDRENAAKTSINNNDATLKILAFKALHSRPTIIGDGDESQSVSEKQLINNMSDEIKKATLGSEGSGAPGFLEDKDIISLEEAKKSTGLVEQWGHSLKRMVWG